MTLTAYGLREWGSALIALIAILAGCWWLIQRGGFPVVGWSVAVIAVILFMSIAFFFRNPVRHIPKNPLFVISPADGTVRDIEIVDDFTMAPFEGKALRVGIFLSVFNVHVNRAPAEMVVETLNYRPGKYLDARDKGASKENEAMTIAGTAKIENETFPLAVRQISGAVARRIVCPVKPGRNLKKGEIYGMIKFGSRTEIYLPVEGFELNIKIGDKVRGGETIIATKTN
jgi:phosphatidylserine decarboxylase